MYIRAEELKREITNYKNFLKEEIDEKTDLWFKTIQEDKERKKLFIDKQNIPEQITEKTTEEYTNAELVFFKFMDVAVHLEIMKKANQIKQHDFDKMYNKYLDALYILKQ